jgi:hypothetical protein
MKKILLGVLIGGAGVAGWNYFHQPAAAIDVVESTGFADEAAPGVPGVETRDEDTGRFSCDGRTRCSQMTSCDEAKYFLAHCPGVKMDGEGDGIPCEGQWCGEH